MNLATAKLAFREQGFGVCLPFLFLGLGGIFGGVEFEDTGEEKTGGGFDNAVGFSSPLHYRRRIEKFKNYGIIRNW